ncbi:acyltransferase [Mesorhizobium sp. USDA-HM6]|nr:acyltransferase [Mesorhizobium sp. USDA-HM6]
MEVDHNLSSRINLMRIILISGIVFVHVPVVPQMSPFAGQFGWFDWLRIFLGDSLFRSGVPCLSAISGYLLFRSGLAHFSYQRILRSKALTVVVPFLAWNLGLLTVVLLMQYVSVGIGYFPDLWSASPREMLRHAFALEGLPVNIPLYFLRDLIVCNLLSPLLAFFVYRMPTLTCSALFALAIAPDVATGVVLKKSILFSFAFGMALALHGIDPKALDRHAVAGVAVTVLGAVLLSLALLLLGPECPFWLRLARNAFWIVGALGFWLASAMLIRTEAGRRLSNSGSLSFWIFCAHYPVLVGLWMLWDRTSNYGGYPLFYAGAVIVTFSILLVTNRAMARWAPFAYRVLTGSRSRTNKVSTSTG